MAVAIIIAAIIISAILVVSIPSSWDKLSWRGQYHVGDFVEYRTQRSYDAITEHFTVVAVSSTNVTVNYTYTDGINEHSSTDVIPVDTTFAFGFYPDLSRNPDQKDKLVINDETVVTNWGSLNCQHIATKYADYDSAYDRWSYHGIVVHYTISAHLTSTNGILVDTNMEEVTSAR